MHGPPRNPGITDQSDEGDGEGETSVQGWEIEITCGDGADGEDRFSPALDIILASAARAQGLGC